MMNNDERLTFALPRFQTSKKVSVWVKPLKKVQKCDEKMLSILITIISPPTRRKGENNTQI
jgi:hypothetical protein